MHHHAREAKWFKKQNNKSTNQWSKDKTGVMCYRLRVPVSVSCLATVFWVTGKQDQAT